MWDIRLYSPGVNGTFRLGSVSAILFFAERSLISWMFQPKIMDISAKKDGRFGQNVSGIIYQ